jgi:hypothetical protein
LLQQTALLSDKYLRSSRYLDWESRNKNFNVRFPLLQVSVPRIAIRGCTVRSQSNGSFSKVNKKYISRLTLVKRTPSAAATVQVSHALPVVRFS